jgi:hypothetical protein
MEILTKQGVNQFRKYGTLSLKIVILSLDKNLRNYYILGSFFEKQTLKTKNPKPKRLGWGNKSQ